MMKKVNIISKALLIMGVVFLVLPIISDTPILINLLVTTVGFIGAYIFKD